MALTVSNRPTGSLSPAVYQLAEQITADGLDFVADGRQIMEICDRLGAEWVGLDDGALYQMLSSTLILLARRYGWKHRHPITDGHKDAILGFYVSIWMQANRQTAPGFGVSAPQNGF